MTRAHREAAYRRGVRAARLSALVGRSLGRKRRRLLDRALLGIVGRLARRRTESDFMRDEIVDAGIAFDPRELELYSRILQTSGERT